MSLWVAYGTVVHVNDHKTWFILISPTFWNLLLKLITTLKKKKKSKKEQSRNVSWSIHVFQHLLSSAIKHSHIIFLIFFQIIIFFWLKGFHFYDIFIWNYLIVIKCMMMSFMLNPDTLQNSLHQLESNY